MDKFRQAWIPANHKRSRHFTPWGHTFRWKCIMKLVDKRLPEMRRHSKMGFKPKWGGK
jgi:hypothetical protein